jgi:hypothetical protein
MALAVPLPVALALAIAVALALALALGLCFATETPSLFCPHPPLPKFAFTESALAVAVDEDCHHRAVDNAGTLDDGYLRKAPLLRAP